MPGTVAPDAGSTQCELCLPGFVVVISMGFLIEGRYGFVDATVDCEVCEKGFFKAEVGVGNCTACADGRASCSAGHLTLRKGTVAVSLASSACTPCPSGSYAASADSPCVPCAPGTFQEKSSQTS